MAGQHDKRDLPADATLVSRARSGDRDAFRQLIERHYDFIFRVAYRWLARQADAEDVAQDVCIKLGTAIGGYAGRGALTSWLYRLTLNAVRDHGRRLARETARDRAFLHESQVLGQGDGEADEEASSRLWAAVRDLPEKQRDSVLMVYGEGLSHAAAADVLACAESTVSWHIHAAKKRLKGVLREAREEL